MSAMDRHIRISEAKVQRTVAEYLDSSPFYRGHWWHTPNERSLRQEAFILKRAGVKPGIPDIIVVRPAGGYAGMALELKRPHAPPSALSAEQRRWLRTFEQCGWYATVARGVDEALDKLRWYAGGAAPP